MSSICRPSSRVRVMLARGVFLSLYAAPRWAKITRRMATRKKLYIQYAQAERITTF